MGMTYYTCKLVLSSIILYSLCAFVACGLSAAGSVVVRAQVPKP